MVRITALFFAAYRDVFGADELEIELPEGATVAALIDIVSRRAASAVPPGSMAVAVNQDYAARDTVLRDGDEVAFIPPVAGG
jgi:molybdopterin converting factor subunit 1